MNNPYETPKSELESELEKPSKKLVHITFWLGHILIILYFYSATNEISNLNITMFLAGALSIFIYFFAIGSYMSKLNRSGITWGGLSMIFSPIGVWVSYIASFFVGYKVKKSNN